MQLGCIADDYTGASDVACALKRAGCRTAVLFGLPRDEGELPETDAAVIALRIRTAPAQVAVDAALAARTWLTERGAARLYFKYCSTFDSTDAGNIGPIAEALVTAGNAPLTVVCPAAPEHGRSVYQGHLFVGSQLLSETAMRDHPLTPMRDSSVVRMLDRQTDGAVALIAHERVRRGAQAVAEALAQLRDDGVRFAVADALSESDLATVAEAATDLPIVTGSAGLAPHVARTGGSSANADTPPPPVPAGPAAILAGSCSAATLEQVERARSRVPSFRLDPLTTPSAEELVTTSRRWLEAAPGDEPVMLYSSAPPEARSTTGAGALEAAMAALAKLVVERGRRRLVVAGGETSAAVLEALDVTACALGAEEARGVPWLFPADRPELALLLKSGNFGDADLLVRAATRPE